jgi:hypothetical protein
VEINKKQQEIAKLRKLIQTELKKCAHGTGWMNHKQKQIDNLETDILVLTYEMNVIPLFHPRDSIYGLQSREVLVGTKIEKKYFVATKQENEEKIVKEITLSWLQESVDKNTFEYFKKYENEKGWIVLNEDGPSVFETPDDEIEEL